MLHRVFTKQLQGVCVWLCVCDCVCVCVCVCAYVYVCVYIGPYWSTDSRMDNCNLTQYNLASLVWTKKSQLHVSICWYHQIRLMSSKFPVLFTSWCLFLAVNYFNLIIGKPLKIMEVTIISFSHFLTQRSFKKAHFKWAT